MKVFVTGGSGSVGQKLIPLLISKGYDVFALARSEKSMAIIEELGAHAIEGDLNNISAIKKGLAGCHAVFHLAASVDFFASAKALYPLHVTSTQNLLMEAKTARVKKFVYLSAASVIMNGEVIRNADESFVSDNVIDGYSQTKLAAEKLTLKANSPDFKTIAIRAPLIWGKGDQHVLPSIIEVIQKGKMQFIGNGLHKIVTCHVKNVCEALMLANDTDQGGGTYFITDGEPVIFKDFITQYVGTQGVVVPDKMVSLKAAKTIASIMELMWKLLRLKGQPPLYRAMVNTLGLEFTVNDQKARQELGYKNVISVEQGMIDMYLI